MTGGLDGLPDLLRPRAGLPFVGRTVEIGALVALMPSAAAAQRRVVLVSGEAGSGKSRLVGEVARALAAEGALVLYGACDAVVKTPYGPFVEALDRLVGVLESGPDPAQALGPGGGELARLLPDLPARIAGLSAPVEADPDTVRHRLHTAVSGLLARAGAERPLLLVLEDGHWADAGTLLLLRHLARSSWGGRVLIVVTLRDTELEVSPVLSDTLADLRRVDDVVRVRLDGLSGADVADFVRRAADSDELGPQARVLAETIHGLTDGNAFLVCELWRALVETGTVLVDDGRIAVARPLGEIATPAGVREVVSQRLARLHPGAGQLLELAATIGPEFELDVVRRAAGMDERELLAALEETVASGMIEELPGSRLACRFTHELVRRAVYDRLSRARRAELHLRVGEALVEGPAAEHALADLAHHFTEAAPLGARAAAVDYNVRAARAAAAALAFDDAAARLRIALDLGIDDDRERALALLDLGAMEHRAGNAATAFEAFSSAAFLARELDSGELLARAAIGYEDTEWRPGELNRDGAAARGGDPRLGESEAAELRVGLLAGLARALDRRGHQARGAIVRDQAIALARRLERPFRAGHRARALLLGGRDEPAGRDPGHARRGQSCWPRSSTTPRRASRRSDGAFRRWCRWATWAPPDGEVVRIAAWPRATPSRSCTTSPSTSARRSRWPTAGWRTPRRWPSARASGASCWSDATPRGPTGSRCSASAVSRAGWASWRRRCGSWPAGPLRDGPWRPGLAAVLVELGMHDEARQGAGRDRGRRPARPAHLAVDGGDDVPGRRRHRAGRRSDRRARLCAARAVGGRERDDRPPGRLLRRGRPLPRHAGLDDRRRALAVAHFERALELNRRMASETWVAHTAYQYARHLLSCRGGAATAEQAQALTPRRARSPRGSG